jgi:hypothetical protein
MTTAASHNDTEPWESECLPCYIIRMLGEFGCDNTLRWAARWRDLRAPDAPDLEDELADQGGYCDCEVALNVHPEQMLRDSQVVPCAGVSWRRSTEPCRPASGTSSGGSHDPGRISLSRRVKYSSASRTNHRLYRTGP